MDWNQHYEKVMILNGLDPYGCSYSYCNHRARGTWGMLIHELFGAHHGSHRRSKTKNR